MIKSKDYAGLVDYLLFRWKILTPFAATEQMHRQTIELSKKRNLPINEETEFTKEQFITQINMIKNLIASNMPKVDFIKQDYQSPSELTPEDFGELYANHQLMCIEKVIQVINSC